MKILLPITLLIFASTSSHGAFEIKNGASQSDNGVGGYTPDVKSEVYHSPAPSEAAKPNNTSNSDIGKKIQKVTRGGVVTYSWASPYKASPYKASLYKGASPYQTSQKTKIEIITIAKSGVSNGVTSSASSTSTCRAENIGVNTAGLAYYGNAMPFKNIAKASPPWDADSPLDVDADGYVKSLGVDSARTIITDDNWGRAVDDNKYVVLYDGEGQLEFMYRTPKVVKTEPGRIEIEFQGRGRYGLSQKSTNPANYLRNIRIVPLENEHDYDKTIIRKKYSDTWGGVGVMRYLNSQQTNNSTEVEWSDRQKGTTFGTKHGQSLEDIIQMSNEMGTSPWILAPHLASDDYFKQMAIYVRDNLNPNLKVYIEYTNEAWNFGFAQASYLYELSQKNGTSRQLEYGLRSKKLFDVWGDVFGESDRLVRVIGTQLYYPWISEQIFKTPGLAESVDALAVGYYIGNEFSGDELGEKVASMTDKEVFDHVYNVSLPKAEKALTEQKSIADKHNVKLIAYEAGQHFLAGTKRRENTAVVNRFIEINRSPKMYQLYLDMYKQWNEVGGGLIVWFETISKSSKWGNWGLLDDISQDPSSAPKYRAYKKILSDNGC